MELFLGIFASLFSVLNPLGTVPVFVSLTKTEESSERNKTALWTSINVFIILIISFFIGNSVLSFFGITIPSLRIAGGLVIVSSGFALLTGSFSKHKGMKRTSVKEDVTQRSEIALTPLAIPMLAGPGSISLLIDFHAKYKNPFQIVQILLAILTIAFIIFILLRYAHSIVKMLGASGINAISRIIGFIVIAIGIEMTSVSVLEIIRHFIKTL